MLVFGLRLGKENSYGEKRVCLGVLEPIRFNKRGIMTISTVRLYHPALWKILFTYRIVLVTLRSVENLLNAAYYMFFRGPLLIAWTRFPPTRDRQPPVWKSLATVVAPVQGRASLSVGGGQMGSDFALVSSVKNMSSLQNAVVGSARPPSGIWTILGSYMRGLFTAMGPAFIKFGQILSMREEIPPVLKTELSLLQDKLPPMPYKTIKKILERELDRPVEEVFEWVEETPIASASLAQVHRAKLRREQEEVALKIQRPYLQGIVVLDTIYLCDIVIGIIKRAMPTFSRGADFGMFTTSYRESLAKEIDFNLEERTQNKFRRRVMDHPIYSQSHKIARTYREYTTTKLLTMELVKNYHRLDRIMDELAPQQLLDFATTKLEGVPRDLPLQLVWTQLALQFQALSHWGISHGDVHLGNLYALAPETKEDRWRLFLCDFGMMIDEDEGFRIMCVETGASFTYYWDGAIAGHAFAKQSVKPLTPRNKALLIDYMATSVDKFFVETREGAEKVWLPKIQRGTSNTMNSELVYGVSTLGLSLSPGNWLLLKNFAYLINMSMTLWTTLNAGDMWAPHAKKYVKDVILHDLESKNISNMRDSLPEIFTVLRDHDRRQVLRALETDSPVLPLEPALTHDWDVRGLGALGSDSSGVIEASEVSTGGR
jgi:predicted unusual protein kinase regulating ubiquinone biosynthesis (AarF/ABC1/UbiB family)